MLKSMKYFYLICALLCSCCSIACAQDGVDLTTEPEVRGSLAVETVMDRIERSAIFENDFGYIRRIAWVETRDGLNRAFTFRPGYHGGLWQVDEVVFQETKNTAAYPLLIEKYQQIRVEFDIEWPTMEWEELRKPLHCGLAVWLYMFTRSESIPLNIHDQADHWKRNYNRLHHVDFTVEEFVLRVNQLETMTADCYRDIDLYIVLDSSGSIDAGPYEVAKNFIADLVNGFTVGENNVRVGLIIFSSDVDLIFDLDNSFDNAVILNLIRGAPFLNGGTATGEGILLMANTGFTETRGARPLNLAIPRVGIVFTDGHSNGAVDVGIAAVAARDLSIELFALGIGDGIDDDELLEIAGYQDRVFRIDNITNLNDVRALITTGSCKSSVKADINTTYTGDLDNSEGRSFEYALPEDGITIQLEMTMGSVTLYGSYSNPNPSPIWYDFLVQDIRQSRDVFIPHPMLSGSRRRKRQNVRIIVFYCTLIGAAPQHNQFAISALNGTRGCNCGCGG